MSKISVFIDKLQGVRKTGRGFLARCPAHKDRSPSLSFKETAEGNVLLHCFAGCSFGDILNALDLTAKDAFSDSRAYTDGRRHLTKTYERQRKMNAIESEKYFLQRKYGLTSQYASRLILNRINVESDPSRIAQLEQGQREADRAFAEGSDAV